MRLRTAAMAMPAGARTFTWSFQGDAQAPDPDVPNETFAPGLPGNVHEGLVRRGPDLRSMPCHVVKR